MQSKTDPRGGVISIYATAALAASLVLSLHLFAQPLRPWPDQGWMLQAAIRHARGEGLTTQMNSQSHDLTRPAYDRLVYFPPGYPLLISAMLRAGMNVEAAVKATNAAALAIGMFGWLALALPLLERRAFRILFTALLVLACGGVIVKGGTTDMLFWAGVPWWIACVARARGRDDRSRVWLLVAAAAINAALISIRWAAAFLVPVGVLAEMIPLRRDVRGLMKDAVAAATFALPPTLVYLAIGAINRHYASASSVLSFTKAGWRPRYLLTLYPLQALFAIPVGLEPLLDRVWRSIDPAMSAGWGIAIFRVALPLLLVASILVVAGRAGPMASGSTKVLMVITLVAVGLVAFLAWMALRYNWGFVDWSFLSEPRYYRPFLPAFLLTWLVLFERMSSRRAQVAGAAIFAISCVYLLQAAARWEWGWLRTADESLELVAKVESLTANPGLNVVLDADISDYVIHPKPNLIAGGYPEDAEIARCRVGQPATIWLVRRVHEQTAYLLDRDADRRRFEALRRRFGATRVWASSGGNYEIYANSVINGQL
ncbi:MAG TPA: hypothetical protein VEZ11_13035 [Thermoanaerobaculia bacterium]|nr:hypothetical protein [Thermoanaerobaculia bacterium]